VPGTTKKKKIEEEEHRTGERRRSTSNTVTSPRFTTVTPYLHTHTFNYKRDSFSSCYFIENHNTLYYSYSSSPIRSIVTININ
jgi:hypothetical protein